MNGICQCALNLCSVCGEDETGASDARRFTLELEFVQCLANPAYLNCERDILGWDTDWFDRDAPTISGRSHELNTRACVWMVGVLGVWWPGLGLLAMRAGLFPRGMAGPDMVEPSHTGTGLSQERYFEDAAFVRYLEYLQYWKRPEYSRFIIYPHALYFLDQLQRADFRAAIADPGYKDRVHTQQLYFWQYWRSRQLQAAAQARAGAAQGETAR